jgi:hypothetical protein
MTLNNVATYLKKDVKDIRRIIRKNTLLPNQPKYYFIIIPFQNLHFFYHYFYFFLTLPLFFM